MRKEKDMHDTDSIIDAVKKPLKHFCTAMQHSIGDWRPLQRAADKILAGETVPDDEVQPQMQFLVDWMHRIMEVTRNGHWDWNSPEVQQIYRQYAESLMYRIFADSLAEIVTAIVQTGRVGTVLEIGSGPGMATEALCRDMDAAGLSVPICIADAAPAIRDTGTSLRARFPGLSISDFMWDIRSEAPEALLQSLKPPVLAFERFCIPYGGYDAIDRIAPACDMLLMLEDFNLTDTKEAYDIIFEKIGLAFFSYAETRKRCARHFSHVHAFETPEATNLPDTCFFVLAIK
jgi:hypothetical protein